MSHAHRSAGALVLAALLGGCGSADVAGTANAPADGLRGSWELVGGSTEQGALRLVDTAPVTLVIDGDQASGRSACNGYSATLERSGHRVGFGAIGGTEMACEEPVMALEARYLTALATVDGAEVSADRLVLRGPAVRLDFDRQAPVPTALLVGTTWRLESLLGGPGLSGTLAPDGVASSVTGPADLLLRADGTLRGSTGCRPFVGRYVVHGSEVVVTDLDASIEPVEQCSAETAGQDGHVLEVLGDGFRVRVDGQTMVAEVPGGRRGLAYRAG